MFYLEAFEVVHESLSDALYLRRDDRQHRGVHAIELIETTPGSALSQARQDLPHGLRHTQLLLQT